MARQYELVRVITRKNKDNKDYYLALVLFNREEDSDLLRILVTKEVAEELMALDYESILEDGCLVDISDKVFIEYNSYQKQYQPKIKI